MDIIRGISNPGDDYYESNELLGDP